MGKEWDNFKPSKIDKAMEQDKRKHTQIASQRRSNTAGTYDLSRRGVLGYQNWYCEIMKECLRVLKPGGHLLSFGGTRTYHRMACAIEDAGFEVRDMINWVYSTGFPKSLNIGKAVDKLQGNEREKVGENPNHRLKENYRGVLKNMNQHTGDGSLTKGTSEWEGWGTSLKPAHEPICLARKPLSDGGLDIAENICYNIIKKGLVNNDKILWRIKLVKNVDKQKTKNYSIQTQQQKMVVISAEIVETKENDCVGKKIQKLIESICENGEMKTLIRQEPSVQNTTEQTNNEFYNTGKPISEKEKKMPLKNMEESVNVVEKQDLNFLPLTTLAEEEENIEKKSKTETSMSSLKKQDTQKKDLDYSAVTVTSQWVCMDIVRTIKIDFEGKEYDFDQLSDGSLIWNDKLKPFREPKPLNVAQNVLKWKTGGLNIDESRVEYDGEKPSGWFNETERKNSGFKLTPGKNNKITSTPGNGRFPANLILSFTENEYIMKEDITNEQKEKVCTWLQKNL